MRRRFGLTGPSRQSAARLETLDSDLYHDRLRHHAVPDCRIRRVALDGKQVTRLQPRPSFCSIAFPAHVCCCSSARRGTVPCCRLPRVCQNDWLYQYNRGQWRRLRITSLCVWQPEPREYGRRFLSGLDLPQERDDYNRLYKESPIASVVKSLLIGGGQVNNAQSTRVSCRKANS